MSEEEDKKRGGPDRRDNDRRKVDIPIEVERRYVAYRRNLAPRRLPPPKLLPPEE